MLGEWHKKNNSTSRERKTAHWTNGHTSTMGNSKRCPVSLLIREICWSHEELLHPADKAVTDGSTSAGRDTEQQQLSHSWWQQKLVQRCGQPSGITYESWTHTLPKVQWYDITGTHLHPDMSKDMHGSFTVTALIRKQPEYLQCIGHNGGASVRGWPTVKAREHQWGWLCKHSAKRRKETQEPQIMIPLTLEAGEMTLGCQVSGSSYLWEGEWSGDCPGPRCVLRDGNIGWSLRTVSPKSSL